MTAAAPPRKKILARAGHDRSQSLRGVFQLAFLGLNAWIGIEFVLFVRFYESGGATVWAERPPGVEGWLPIASLMNLKLFLATGEVPHLHPAGMFLLTAFLAMSWIFRKSFCAWLCPLGTVSEYLWKVGRETFGRNFVLPRRLDLPLRGLKYVLLGLFLYAAGSMPVETTRAFLESPYGVIGDVKMLNFFRYLSVTAAVVIGLLVLASVFVQNFWCRYLCPYGGLLGLLGMAGPVGIRRDTNLCIDCGKCSRACPSLLPVDRLITVKSAECTACMQCVAVCPAEGALLLAAPRRRRVPAWLLAAGVAALFLGVCGWARWAGCWRTDLPSQVYFDLIPRAREFSHP